VNATRYECDVAVIGAGPAGIAAGAIAAEAGARTIVVDEGVGPGGQIWRPSAKVAQPSRAAAWIERLKSSPATVLCSTGVIGVERMNGAFSLRAESIEGAAEIVADRIVLATGARELFLPFPGWTLPSVMGIGGAQALLKSGTNFQGRRVVMSGSGPLMLPVAASLAKAGAKLLLVAEQAPLSTVTRYAAGLWNKPSMLLQAATLRWGFRGTRYRTGAWVTEARGDDVLREVTVTDGMSSWIIACDVLCTGFGLVPNTELARLLGCDVRGRFVVVDDAGATSVAGVYAAGETTGIGGVHAAIVEGELAGAAVAGEPTTQACVAHRRRLAHDAASLERTFAPRPELMALAASETIVCRCEDVRFAEIEPGWTARQAKLYTRAGMGPCQGRVCGAALECVMGWAADSVRPPIQPARLSTFISDFSTTAHLPPTE
jgi:NADPH-dependent 2,4-dienoyl-CoA reductase/sulfur reductase-like enzyme